VIQTGANSKSDSVNVSTNGQDVAVKVSSSYCNTGCQLHLGLILK